MITNAYKLTPIVENKGPLFEDWQHHTVAFWAKHNQNNMEGIVMFDASGVLCLDMLLFSDGHPRFGSAFSGSMEYFYDRGGDEVSTNYQWGTIKDDYYQLHLPKEQTDLKQFILYRTKDMLKSKLGEETSIVETQSPTTEVSTHLSLLRSMTVCSLIATWRLLETAAKRNNLRSQKSPSMRISCVMLIVMLVPESNVHSNMKAGLALEALALAPKEK